jgi:hypothetical protein
MGELVAFRQSTAPRRRNSTAGQTAEILFFTGVRYVPVWEHAKLLKGTRQQPRRVRAERLAQEHPQP